MKTDIQALLDSLSQCSYQLDGEHVCTSKTQRNDAMITNLTDNDVLIKLESHTDVLKFLIKLSPDELELFDQIQRLPVPLLSILSSHTDVLKFLIKLSPDELDSFAEMQHWPVPLLTMFRNHPELLRILFNVWDMLSDKESFCKAYSTMASLPSADNVNINDAFSHGQLSSKQWLIDTVKSLDLSVGRAWTLCGWIGTLGYLMLLHQDSLRLTSIRSFDIDDHCATLADTLNRASVKDNWKFKASTVDVNTVVYDNFMHYSLRYDGSVVEQCDSADTVINTSCDHMGGNNSWWDRIPSDKLIILQNNNWHENDQHNNSAADLNEFTRMYPMSELLFAGELDCTLYTRFMLIGRK